MIALQRTCRSAPTSLGCANAIFRCVKSFNLFDRLLRAKDTSWFLRCHSQMLELLSQQLCEGTNWIVEVANAGKDAASRLRSKSLETQLKTPHIVRVLKPSPNMIICPTMLRNISCCCFCCRVWRRSDSIKLIDDRYKTQRAFPRL